MYWLEFFFTWPFSSRCDYIILYSYYKIEREFVVNTFNTLFGDANGVLFFVYIYPQAVKYIVYCWGGFFGEFKETMVQVAICLFVVCLIIPVTTT